MARLIPVVLLLGLAGGLLFITLYDPPLEVYVAVEPSVQTIDPYCYITRVGDGIGVQALDPTCHETLALYCSAPSTPTGLKVIP